MTELNVAILEHLTEWISNEYPDISISRSWGPGAYITLDKDHSNAYYRVVITMTGSEVHVVRSNLLTEHFDLADPQVLALIKASIINWIWSKPAV